MASSSSSSSSSSSQSYPRRRLGWTNELVSAIGFGAMGLSEFYGPTPDAAASVALLHEIVDRGVNVIDTAEIYGPHTNERLLSQLLQQRRKDVFICTKFGIQRDPANPTFRGIDSSPAMVRKSCEASLQRLGIGTIDLYYQHRVDPKTPIEDTVGVLKELISEGKVRYYGLSECSAATLRRAHAVHPCAAVQIEYSPWTTDIETNGILQACRELDIAVIAYSPLGRGFLSGSIRSIDDLAPDDFRRHNPRFSAENFPINLKLVDALTDMAKAKGCTAGQLCLAWLLRQDRLIIPIPGTKKLEFFKENAASVDVAVSESEAKKIRAIIDQFPVSGTRYAEAMMKTLNL